MSTHSSETRDRPGAARPSIYRILLKGFSWVVIPGAFLGYLALFWDPYSMWLGANICDGEFVIRKLAHNVIDMENSYRFFCVADSGETASMTFLIFVQSALLWYLVSSVVWLWIWYGDYVKARPGVSD